ncbi:MAG: hypothetical protein LBI78_07155 [Campylobacteraceae bacterium]|jgi:hypothetical protein|nr:hypothetical protein [Campylobacteraceae bacterium]
MRKLFCVFVFALSAFVLVGCGGGGNSDSNVNDNQNVKFSTLAKEFSTFYLPTAKHDYYIYGTAREVSNITLQRISEIIAQDSYTCLSSNYCYKENPYSLIDNITIESGLLNDKNIVLISYKTFFKKDDIFENIFSNAGNEFFYSIDFCGNQNLLILDAESQMAVNNGFSLNTYDGFYYKPDGNILYAYSYNSNGISYNIAKKDKFQEYGLVPEMVCN